jgi:hypothetical protein
MPWAPSLSRKGRSVPVQPRLVAPLRPTQRIHPTAKAQPGACRGFAQTRLVRGRPESWPMSRPPKHRFKDGGHPSRRRTRRQTHHTRRCFLLSGASRWPFKIRTSRPRMGSLRSGPQYRYRYRRRFTMPLYQRCRQLLPPMPQKSMDHRKQHRGRPSRLRCGLWCASLPSSR